jgi:hypothetical protein
MRIKCEKEFILYFDFFTSKLQFYINPWIRNQNWKMDPDPVPATQMKMVPCEFVSGSTTLVGTFTGS